MRTYFDNNSATVDSTKYTTAGKIKILIFLVVKLLDRWLYRVKERIADISMDFFDDSKHGNFNVRKFVQTTVKILKLWLAIAMLLTRLSGKVRNYLTNRLPGVKNAVLQFITHASTY